MVDLHRHGPAGVASRPSFGQVHPFLRGRGVSEQMGDPSSALRSVALSDADDHQLLDAVGAGSVAALSELFARHGAATYELVRLLADGPTAEAIRHEVFVCLWHRFGRLEDPVYNVRLGLLAMARRRCVAPRRLIPEVARASNGGTGAFMPGLGDEQRHALVLTVLGQAALAELAVVPGTDRATTATYLRSGQRTARLRLVPTGAADAGSAPSPEGGPHHGGPGRRG